MQRTLTVHLVFQHFPVLEFPKGVPGNELTRGSGFLLPIHPILHSCAARASPDKLFQKGDNVCSSHAR